MSDNHHTAYVSGEKVLVQDETYLDDFEELNDKLDGELKEILERRISKVEAQIVWETVCKFAAEMRKHENPAMTLDCFCFAAGLYIIDGKTQTQLAKEHGVKRATISKRVVQISKEFNFPPVNGMKSKAARESYSRAHTKKKK